MFAESYAGRLRFDHSRGRWFVWTGTHWREDQVGGGFEFVRLFVRNLARGLETRSQQEALGRLSFAEKVERGAKTDRRLAVTSNDWDANPFLLGTPGGTVDLKSGILRPADPKDLITKQTSVAPSAHADCPRFLQFLDEATGSDQELIRFIQQFAGYSLTGSIREHALVFIYGDGGTGKGTFVRVLAGILKDYAKVSPMETFMASNNPRHETEIAMLAGSRVAIASETEKGRTWAESKIKNLTGGEPLSARFMHKDFFSFDPTFKLWIIGNHPPALKSIDNAIKRRFNVIPFTRVPASVDMLLDEKLRAEWPGILRWMIEGAKDWLSAGLVRPASVAAATKDYLASQDMLSRWLDECCELGEWPEYRCEPKPLGDSFREFLTSVGADPKMYGDAIRERFGEQKTVKGRRYYRGVRLKQQ
jgi:putative DNA primase/helicase